MLVRLYKSQLDYFRKKARNSSVEIYACLVGRCLKNNIVEVESFKFPLVFEATPSWVTLENGAYEAVQADAASIGLSVVGSIHTHPNCLPIMSNIDYDSHISSNAKISGIVEVSKDRKTRYAFWTHNSSLQCEVEYF